MSDLIKYDPAEDYWLGINTLQDISVANNPLFGRDFQAEEMPGMRELTAMKNPRYLAHWSHLIFGITLPTYQMVIQRELWTHAFPMFIASRGGAKSFSLALFSLTYALLVPNSKVVLAGASFRQSKMIFEYIEKLWAEAPMLRSMCRRGDGAKKNTDRWVFTVNSSTITAIPIGPSGDKIRGLRANVTICDEFAAHNPTIVEEVIFGFGAVANNPVQSMQKEFMIRYFKERGYDLQAEMLDSEEEKRLLKNKSIISGTADYYFNHFYDYWQRYCSIIRSRGDQEVLEKIFRGEVPEAFDWKDFSVIRLPYSLLPPGYMDDAVVARAKSQMTKSLYLKEYEAIFVEDSDGFFQRSTIERCVAKEKNLEEIPFCDAPFDIQMKGHEDRVYAMGIDPAAKDDNLAIVVLEVYSDHNRIIHCWTTNEQDFRKRQIAGFTYDTDYYTFCANKIRSLLKEFPTDVIGIDAQGGGHTLMERLRDESILKKGEQPFYENIDPEKPKESDTKHGLHIMYPVQFANAQWLREANWGLKGDLESRRLLFPNYDALTVELSINEDRKRADRYKKKLGENVEVVLFDSIEDCAEEIETLKDELTNIVYSKTASGRERWDVPEVMTDKNKKVQGKKDRYSALLIANALAREARVRISEEIHYEVTGGLAKEMSVKSNRRKPTPEVWEMYSGPYWK